MPDTMTEQEWQNTFYPERGQAGRPEIVEADEERTDLEETDQYGFEIEDDDYDVEAGYDATEYWND